MPITIQGWLPKLDNSTTYSIEKIRVTTYDKDSVENYNEIIVEDVDQNVELADALRMFRFNLYGISEVSTILNSFTLLEDRTTELTAGEEIIVENSTGNNGVYTIVSSIYYPTENETVLIVSETISDSTADGNIYKNEVLT